MSAKIVVAVALVWGFVGGVMGGVVHDHMGAAHRGEVTIESVTIDGDDIPDVATDEPEGIDV